MPQQAPKTIEEALAAGYKRIPAPSQVSEQAVDPYRSLLQKLTAFVAAEGPKGIGATAGAVLGAATGPYAPAAIPAFATAGAVLGEAGRQAITTAFDLPGKPAGWREAAERLIGFPTGAVYEGPLQEAGTAYRAAKLGIRGLAAAPPALGVAAAERLPVAPAAMRAAEFDVPMTMAQATQGKVRSAIEGFLRKTIFGQQIFDTFDRKAAARLTSAADELSSQLSPQRLSQLEWGTAIQEALDGYMTQFGAAYDDALKQIVNAGGGDVLLDIKALAVPAKELLGKITPPPQYKEVVRGPLGQSLQEAIKILGAFARTTQKVKGGKPGLVKQKTLTFEEARNLRSILFSLTNRADLDIAKGALKKMNEELDTAMGTALKEAGFKDLYTNWHQASSNYRRAKDVTRSTIFQAINRNATPEEIAKGILSSGAESKLLLLSEVAPQLRRPTSAAIFAAAYDRSVREGMLLGDTIERILGDIPGAKLSKEAQEIVFPGILGEKIHRFVNLVDSISLKAGLTRPIAAQPIPLAAFGQAAAVGGAITAPVVLQPTAEGLLLSLAGGASTLLTPAMFTKLITSPNATDMATRALKLTVNTAAGRALAHRLATLVGLAPGTIAPVPSRIPTAPPDIAEMLRRAPTPRQ